MGKKRSKEPPQVCDAFIISNLGHQGSWIYLCNIGSLLIFVYCIPVLLWQGGTSLYSLWFYKINKHGWCVQSVIIHPKSLRLMLWSKEASRWIFLFLCLHWLGRRYSVSFISDSVCVYSVILYIYLYIYLYMYAYNVHAYLYMCQLFIF